MNNRFIVLSYPLDADTPLYGNTPKPELKQLKSIEKGDSSNSWMLNLCNHSSTHIDAPMHFVKGGKGISEYSANDLVFHNPAIAHIPKEAGKWIENEDVENLQLNNADCLLIRTDFGKFRGTDAYRMDNPGISPEAILFIREKFKKIRCIGIDTVSISGFQDRPRGRTAHKAAFGKKEGLGEPLLLIEDMDLAPLEKIEKIRNLIVVPWQVKNIDSAPCTVLAEAV